MALSLYNERGRRIGKTLAEGGGQVEACLMKDVRPRLLLGTGGRQRHPRVELVAGGHPVYADSICDIGWQAISLNYKDGSGSNIKVTVASHG